MSSGKPSDKIVIREATSFRGTLVPPPDKSISHRAVFFCSLARGKSRVKNFLFAQDPLSTVRAFRSLGIAIEQERDSLIIYGKGLRGLSEPGNIIDCGNSGTTIRLLTGVLSGSPFLSILTGDDSIRRRPMARVIKPCSTMGAVIHARSNNNFPPIAISGGNLKPITYAMPVASAQVKSALILAALSAEGVSEITEPGKSRDHTERMLPAFGADIRVQGNTVVVTGGNDLLAHDIEVPGDFSSAAFFIAGALLVNGAEVTIRNCGLNPTRTGFLNVVRRMGGNIAIEHEREISGELIGDIVCRHSPGLKGVKVDGNEIPLLIDEFPILVLLATQAEGVTEIRNAEELRVKESDRIGAMAENLRILGARLEEHRDGMTIEGVTPLRGGNVKSYDDHRIAMTMAMAGLIAQSEVGIEGVSSVDISFPGFFTTLKKFVQRRKPQRRRVMNSD